MIQIKDKYKGVKISNGLVRPINTDDIPPSSYEVYSKKGFDFIFEEIEATPKKVSKKTPKKTSKK